MWLQPKFKNLLLTISTTCLHSTWQFSDSETHNHSLPPCLSWFPLHRAFPPLLLWKPTVFKRHHSQEVWCPVSKPSYYCSSLHSPMVLNPPDDAIYFPWTLKFYLCISHATYILHFYPAFTGYQGTCFSYFHFSVKCLGCKLLEVSSYILIFACPSTTELIFPRRG